MRALVLSIAALLAIGCETSASLGGSCTYPSDCASGLVCSRGRCREACRASRDCDPGERCLVEPATGLGACSIPDADRCARGDECATGFLCVAGECLNACGAIVSCPDGLCVDGACITVPDGDAGIPTDASDDVPDASAPCHGPGCDPVIDLAMHGDSVFAVTASGAVWGWGDAANASLGDGLSVHPGCADCALTPISARDVDGDPFEDAIEVVAGAHFPACVRRRDQTVWCWGRELPTQLTAGGVPITDAVALVGGLDHLCVLRGAQREAWCAGNSSAGELGTGAEGFSMEAVRATELPSGVAQLAVYDAVTLARYDDGTALAVGLDECLMLGGATLNAHVLVATPIPVTSTRALAVSQWNVCALSTTAELRCWGYAGYGPGVLGETTTTFPECAGCASGAGPCTATPQTIVQPSAGALTRIFGGGDGTFFGTTEAGVLYAWGGGGLGPIDTNPTPGRVDLPAGTLVRDVVTNTAACAATIEGDVYCFGHGDRGQLGRGALVTTGRAAVGLVVWP